MLDNLVVPKRVARGGFGAEAPLLVVRLRGSVLLGLQLRILCLETELEKRGEKSGVSISLSVPLDKGKRVGKGV